jgi:hypothetical protein
MTFGRTAGVDALAVTPPCLSCIASPGEVGVLCILRTGFVGASLHE